MRVSCQITASLFFTVVFLHTTAQNEEKKWEDKFKQLNQEFATPNSYRTASGAPGHEYWQQQADYSMKIRLDDELQRIYGEEIVTYHNNSPDDLFYLWMQLDQNYLDKQSDSWKIRQMKIGESVSANDLTDLDPWFDGGFKLDYVQDAAGKNLSYTINKTMMRIDLPQPLKKGGALTFKLKWWYNINDRIRLGGRSGYEYFEEDRNYLYTIAQFYPRMVVYTDYAGWQHKQFLGAGEFTLDFGNYDVAITVPSDHVVAATGELQNMREVLTPEELNRFAKARTSDTPIVIITEDEAREKEKTHSKSEKTWQFKAKNVRDFAFASSRKFIWDAQSVSIGSKRPMAMSFYPKEGNPLWGQHSTRVVAHTLKTYSKYTIEYPYPVAISVHAKWIGMEYPMICFNGGRPETDGTYSESTRNGMISVIIHEVGHNFFPMIINSDERQWTWMDEGLNTFVQYLTEKEWDRNFPTRRGPARNIVDYMKGDKSKMSPVMTNSESIYQFGNNAYGKPATALNILRETVMGRQLFDYAFREYARRWAFKHPTPEDFFRTMEDASSVDLDWFWRGWFYGTDHCDMALKDVKIFRLNSKNPVAEKSSDRKAKESQPADISIERDKAEGIITQVEKESASRDFYTDYDPYKVTVADKKDYESYLSQLSGEEKAMLSENKIYCQVTVENKGGLIMPLIFELKFADGTTREIRLPAEIWKMSEREVNKVFTSEKEIVSINLDPHLETADVDLGNNSWPPVTVPSRFELYKEKKWIEENPMQQEGQK
ncbi:MAG: M1 family metallopeptidase [Crocinitomicaceae bacterium]|nr:M1 family metallopeptidase [Crocinitomicaceae bacterium]